MELAFGASSYVRDRGNFPYLPVINMFAEETPTEGGNSLISRPGLQYQGSELQTDPVLAIFQETGVLNNEYFSIMGNLVYKDDLQLGSIDGFTSATITGYRNLVFFNRGTSIYSYDGTTYTNIAFPDGAPVLRICIGGSRLLAIRKDTQQFYWSDPLSATIDALSFASAENSPDNLYDMVFIGDKLYLFGAKSVEIWPVTTNADLPFQPLQGATFQVGIKNTGAVAELTNTFAWATDSNQICLGKPTEIISFPGLEAKIAQTEAVRLWSFFLEGDEFLACEISSETWVFHLRTGTWSIFSTYGYSRWAASCYTNGRFGSHLSGRFLEWGDTYDEFSGPLERTFRAWTSVTVNQLTLDNVILRVNPGRTPFFTGTYTNPVVRMRTSRDGGIVWTDWRQKSLGENGRYRTQVYWNALGSFTFPGSLIDFNVTDPVSFRVSSVTANDSVGGS